MLSYRWAFFKSLDLELPPKFKKFSHFKIIKAESGTFSEAGGFCKNAGGFCIIAGADSLLY